MATASNSVWHQDALFASVSFFIVVGVSGKDLLETETQLSDEYILLASHLLHDLFTETGVFEIKINVILLS